MQPAQATPEEAATSARSLCPVLAFQQLSPFIPSCLILPARGIPPPLTPRNAAQERHSVACRLCPYIKGKVHGSQEAAERPGGPPYIPEPSHMATSLNTAGE